MKYHLFKNNKTEGPYSEEEIQQMLDDGTLLPEDQISVAGDDWKSVRECSFSPKKNWIYIASGTAAADAIGRLLRRDTTECSSKRFIDLVWRYVREYAGLALLASGIIAITTGAVFSIQSKSVVPFAIAAGYLFAVVPLLQLCTVEFLKAILQITKSRTFRIRTTAVPALMLLLIGGPTIIFWIASCVGFVAAFWVSPGAVYIATFYWILSSFGSAYAFALLITPKELGAEFANASPGEEAMAILGMGITYFAKLVPYWVCACIFSGIGTMILGSANLVNIEQLTSAPGGALTIGIAITAGTAIIPMIAYAIYLIACLPLDIVRSILSIPEGN